MNSLRRFANPPIKEALIDIRAALPQDLNLEVLAQCHERIIDEYPVRKTIRYGEFGIEFKDNKMHQIPPEHSIIGYRFESSDKSRIVQFRTNGFTFSKMEPYESWEDMRNNAQELWALYVDVASPAEIIRVATRYINILRIPIPGMEFEDYLTASPRVPKGLPQTLSSFLSRITVPNETISAAAIITQALEKPEEDCVPVVLDIDVFSSQSFDVKGNSHWDMLEQLRDFKNDAFFSSITKKTEGLFE
jgi:uncharacterized protein (TIGR04255 family)